MRVQIAWSLLPRLVRSCAIVDQRRVRGLALRARVAAEVDDPAVDLSASLQAALRLHRHVEVARSVYDLIEVAVCDDRAVGAVKPTIGNQVLWRET